MVNLKYFLIPLLMIWATSVFSHTNPIGIKEIKGWHMPNIARTVTAGYPDSLGLYAFPRFGFPKIKSIEGKSCIVGSAISFDIDDSFAFDIDEDVELELLFHRKSTQDLFYGYDRNAMAEAVAEIKVPRNGGIWHRETILLKRARFANRGLGQTDIQLVASGAMLPIKKDETNLLTICGIKLKRTYTTPKSRELGNVHLEFIDGETLQSTAVRLGIYDKSGRMPIPGKDALTIKVYDEKVKQLALRADITNAQFWPSKNRYVFYADGRYQAQLPAGNYDLIASKGTEYYIARENLTVKAGKTLKRTIALNRWEDMPKKGWYSGDGHIHITRDKSENRSISAFFAAEDIHVANLLSMTNTVAMHYHQYAWGRTGQYHRGLHNIVPGIESPRTAQMGHTISINITEPITDNTKYFYYHKAFEEYDRQGGLSGFAHLGLNEFYEWRGLALEVPFGTVDFVEIMQFNTLHTELWYDFLNLGFQLTPISGSDYPYFDQPGGVRTYVAVDQAFTTQGWFDGLEAGNAYVTNGPTLTFSVNDQSMGSTIHATDNDKLIIRATAHINPDIDQLDRLELIMHGEVIAQTKARGERYELKLNYELPVKHGMWLAARTYGKRRGLAHTTPIYVHKGEAGAWSVSKAPAILKRIQQWLTELEKAPIKLERELEFWEVHNIEDLWSKQKPGIIPRIQAAREKYKSLEVRINRLSTRISK